MQMPCKKKPTLAGLKAGGGLGELRVLAFQGLGTSGLGYAWGLQSARASSELKMGFFASPFAKFIQEIPGGIGEAREGQGVRTELPESGKNALRKIGQRPVLFQEQTDCPCTEKSSGVFSIH